MSTTQTRRSFLTTLSLAGASSFVRIPSTLAAEGPPETTVIRLARQPTICVAPQFVAEELLRVEGFTDIRYVDTLAPEVPEAVARGKVDYSLAYASQFVASIDAGEPVTLLAGVMVGCFELFGKEGIRSIAELKGKTVGVQALGSTPHVLLTVLAAAAEPARAARRLVDGGFADRYDYALQSLTELPYDKWRDYDPEDSVRFYALRLREAGMTKASPQKIIAEGTDWRFLNELKRELKA